MSNLLAMSHEKIKKIIEGSLPSRLQNNHRKIQFGFAPQVSRVNTTILHTCKCYMFLIFNFKFQLNIVASPNKKKKKASMTSKKDLNLSHLNGMNKPSPTECVVNKNETK